MSPIGWVGERGKAGRENAGPEKCPAQNGFFLKEFSLPGAAKSVTAALW
jgi:hypothetical protein